MGIQGLLPQLKSIMSPIHIKDLQGSSVAIDTYSWLHKGALSCSAQLCKGLPTSRHIDYCMHRVNMLRHYGVTPILVFDGGFLPMKSEQENKRGRSRKDNLARAIEHESSGNSAAAYECYQKAVDISPEIAYELIQVLKRECISYIVAPYEADAQMTYLATTQQVDAVITEDSDLIAFGCPRIIYKMDKYGQGTEFKLQMLQHNRDLSFMGFTNEMLLEMCILSGCDYLPSLPGMGLKRAHALISKFKTFQKVIKHLRYSTVAVPSNYEESFKRAVWTFRHQRVYDPNKEDIVHLSNIQEDTDEDLDFLGPLMPQHVVKAIAKGELDPITKLPFEGNGSPSPALDSTYEIKHFRAGSDKKKLDLPAQKNLLTNYFCFASLEAKRKFRAPRVSPVNSDSANESSPSSGKQLCDDSTACKSNGSSGSLLDFKVPGDLISPLSPMEIDFSQNEFVDLASPVEGIWNLNSSIESSRSIQKSSEALHECHDSELGPRTVVEKENQLDQHDTLRSSYLQHRSVCKSDTNIRSDNVTLRSSYFLDKPDDVDSGRKSKKVVVRSSYFKHMSKKTTACDENNIRLPINGSSVTDENENSVQTESVENNHYEDSYMKRKAPPNHINSKGHVENKYARTEISTGAKSADYPSDSDKLLDVMPDEEKFGCKISHLGHYSDISGKSMDKFVSVISSFRFTTSGSRASGLRAPLRDVKNISFNGSGAPADIGQFSYAPKSGKVPRATSRRH